MSWSGYEVVRDEETLYVVLNDNTRTCIVESEVLHTILY